MAANLYQLAGTGNAGSGYGIASGIGNTLSSAGGALAFVNPWIGLSMLGAGGLTNLITGLVRPGAERAAGRKMFGTAESKYNSRIQNNPNMYSLAGVESVYDQSRKSIRKANQAGTSALLDRYSSAQRRLLKNRINSGLSAGAAQANSIQNNIAFQQQANRLFQQQGQALSNLGIREAQAKESMRGVIAQRKEQAAQRALQASGITNPAALGGLSSRLLGY